MKGYLTRVLLLAVLASVPAFADLLGTGNFSQDSGGIGFANEVVVTFSPRALGGSPETLFDKVFWTMADAGNTVTLMSKADDPNFDAAVQVLTNGLDNHVALGVNTCRPGSSWRWDRDYGIERFRHRLRGRPD